MKNEDKIQAAIHVHVEGVETYMRCLVNVDIEKKEAAIKLSGFEFMVHFTEQEIEQIKDDPFEGIDRWIT